MVQEADTKQPDEMYCSNCGALVKKDVQFCHQCGTAIGGASGPASSAGSVAAAATRASMSSEQPTQPWYTQTWVIVLALLFFFPLGLFLMWRFTRWQTWLKTTITVVLSLLTILFIIGTAAGEEDDTAKAVREEASPSPAVEAPSPTPEPPAETVTYDIAEREDVSFDFGAFGAAIRIVYRVTVSGPLTEDDIRRIAQEIIDDETSQQDVNAIAFFFHLPGTGTTGAYSAGAAFWAPNGDWASADTVRAGDYSKHQFGDIDVGGAIENPAPPADTTGLPEDQRRTIFKELLAAEHRADAEAYAAYPDDVDKQVDLWDELLDKYRAEVCAKYGITEDQSYEIDAEGITQYWPTE